MILSILPRFARFGSHSLACLQVRQCDTIFRNIHLGCLVRKPPLMKCRSVGGSSWLPVARPFSTSRVSRAALPPAVWMVLRPLAKLLAVVFGRTFRQWWRALPTDARARLRARMYRHRRRIAAAGALLAVLSLHYYYTHLQTCDITGRTRFIAFTPDQVEKISREQFDVECQMFAESIVSPEHPAYSVVVRVANRLLAANSALPQIHGRDWTVTVVKDDAVNAYVLPCGNIFVFTGMLEFCGDEDQLGCALSHEMAHAVLGHGGERLSHAHLLDLGLILPLAAIWALMPGDGISAVTHWFFRQMVALLLELPHSRQLETEADALGLQMAARACFDVRAASAFWGRMAVRRDVRGELDVAWLSTHPAHEQRQHSIDSQLPPLLEGRRRWGCGKLPSHDPRDDLPAYRRRCEAEAARAAAAGSQGRSVRLAVPPPSPPPERETDSSQPAPAAAGG